MGWCSGTEVFDSVLDFVLPMTEECWGDQTQVEFVIRLVKALKQQDWDCVNDSRHYDNPIVKRALRMVQHDKV